MALNDEKDFSVKESGSVKIKTGFFDKIFNYFAREDVIVKSIFIVGIFSIIIGITGMYLRVKNSFIGPQIVLEDKASIIEGLNRNKDTDGDRISDYDELNTYNTSPYLEDSDLDGVSDYDQMILGVACTGVNCKTSTSTDSGTVPTQESQFVSLLQGMDYQNMTFEQFKTSLIENGYDANSVSTLTEDEFNQIKQTLPGTSSNSNTSVDEPVTKKLTQDELKQVEEMKSLSIDKIRELMIQGGATQEQLDQLSDEDLKQLYLQTLDEISSSQ